jgi:hypothetical protein
MPWPSSIARPRGRRGRLRCEPLEGRVLLAASLDGPRPAAWEAPPALSADFDIDGRHDLLPPPGEGGWPPPAPGVAMAVADLSGDGLDDFVFANPALDRVIVDVTGLSRSLVAEAPGGHLAPDAVQLADLDGDGLLDLIVCTGAAGLLVYPGLGGGRFGPEAGAAFGLSGQGPARVTVAYLNDRAGDLAGPRMAADPFPDLIVTNLGEGTVSVYLGEGGWRMRRLDDLRVGASPTSALPHDLDGDGLPELVVTDGGSSTVWILPGLGGGRFDDLAPRVLPVGLLPFLSFVADFDGDSRPDLAVVNAGSDDVTLYPDVASPMTTAQTVGSGGAGVVGAILSDLNADGFADLVVANRDDYSLSLLTGGSSGLSLRETLAAPGRPSALAASGEPWKVYVATEDTEQAALLGFTAPDTTVVTPEVTGEVPPALEQPRPEARASLEPPAPGAVGLFPTLLAPLNGDASPPPDEPAVVDDEEDGWEGLAKPAALILSGGSGEDESEGEEEAEPAAPTAEQAVQRFLLGTDEAPPPEVAADGSTARGGDEAGPPPAKPGVVAEDEPPPEPEGPPAAEEPASTEPPVGPPPGEDLTAEAVCLLLALAAARDLPVAGRRGDRAAW